MYCVYCRAENPEDARYCWKCSREIERMLAGGGQSADSHPPIGPPPPVPGPGVHGPTPPAVAPVPFPEPLPRSRRGLHALVWSLVAVAALAGLYLGLTLVAPALLDLYYGRHPLAPRTLQALDGIDQELQITVFLPVRGDPTLRDLLAGCRRHNRNIRYQFIDPDKQPDVARRHNVTMQGTVILKYGGRAAKIEKRAHEVREQDLTDSILLLQKWGTQKVYFVQGHGEKNPSDGGRSGLSGAKKVLQDQGYAVDTLNIAAAGRVPVDATVLVVAGAATEPLFMEIQSITDYLNAGGHLLLLLEPSPAPSFEPFLKLWSVEVDNDIVLDTSGLGRLIGSGPTVPIVYRYETHKITEGFNLGTVFPLARSLSPAREPVSGVTVAPLFKSSETGWGETDLKSTQATFDGKRDLKGPLVLAVAVSKEVRPSTDKNPAVQARMIIVGDSDFAANASLGAVGNSQLFLKMVNWLAWE